MKAKVLRILFSLALVLPITAQKSNLANLSPIRAAGLIEMTLGYENHPTNVTAKKTQDGWNFEIELLRNYTEKTMPHFLGTMIGAVSAATRYTSWKSNRVYILTSGIKFAWITTKACRSIARELESGEIDGDDALKILQSEMHMLIKQLTSGEKKRVSLPAYYPLLLTNPSRVPASFPVAAFKKRWKEQEK